MLLLHIGRKTGRLRRTILEVVRYDVDSHEIIVSSSRGENDDWLKNIRHQSAIEVQVARRRFKPSQKFLTSREAFEELTDYERRGR